LLSAGDVYSPGHCYNNLSMCADVKH
jgi:hypothetical protein